MAFQSSAFQNNAFQVDEVIPPEPTGVVPLASATLTTTRRATATLTGGHVDRYFVGEAVTLTATVLIDGASVSLESGVGTLESAEYTLRRGALEGAGTPEIVKTLGAGVEHSATGQLTVSIDTDDTETLTPGLYYEKLVLTFADAPGQRVFALEPRRRAVHGQGE